MDDNLNQAITLIKSGDKKHGGQLLAEIVKKDPHNLNVWLWLSSCVNTDEQRVYCLQRVLKIDPNHQAALSALSKLQQPGQPSEKEILGKHEEKPMSMNIESIKNGQNENFSFQPKYLTAVAGMGIMIGTVFPWSAMVSGGINLEEYSGLTQAPGILTSVIGLTIVFLSILGQTKPGKANSLISSLLALTTLLMIFIWTTFFGHSAMKYLSTQMQLVIELERDLGMGYQDSRFFLPLSSA